MADNLKIGDRVTIASTPLTEDEREKIVAPVHYLDDRVIKGEGKISQLMLGCYVVLHTDSDDEPTEALYFPTEVTSLEVKEDAAKAGGKDIEVIIKHSVQASIAVDLKHQSGEFTVRSTSKLLNVNDIITCLGLKVKITNVKSEETPDNTFWIFTGVVQK